jgi:tetratricopeptide (TPR) repeat protein
MIQQAPARSLDTTDSIQQIAMRIKRQQRRLYLVGLLAFMVTASFLFFKHSQQKQDKVAQSEMFQAVYHFEQGAFDKALHGDGICAGLLDIVKEYRFTQAANLAHFYAGVSYMHQKDYTKAVQHLTKFKANDFLLQARAWALLGDAYTENKEYPLAITYYMKAAAYKPNKVFTPMYLAKAALVYEAQQAYMAALGCYQRIVQEFPEAEQYIAALKHTARLKAINTASQQFTP